MSLPVIAQQEKLDYVFSTIYSTYTLMGALLNGFLLSLIILHKQQAIQRYRILLGNTTCTLLLLSIMTFFIQPRFVMAANSLAYVPLGPARFINRPLLSLFATALMFVSDIYSFMTLAMCMVYKYITLTRTSPSSKTISGAIGLLFLLPLSSGGALIIYSPDFTKLYATMETVHPEYNLSRYGKYSGVPDVKNYYVLYFYVVVCSIAGLSYIIMIITGLKIRWYVLSNYSNMSRNTTRTFNMMIKALVIQSCMPILFSFPTKTVYFLMQFGLFESLTAEYLVFFVSPMIVVVDPCVTMYYVLPYRNFILRKLRLDENNSFCRNVSVQPTLPIRTFKNTFSSEGA
ncbi:hypothetical protein V3C99_011803 [Haemonchus contortus]